MRSQSTVFVMANQNLLDAINVGKKYLLDTINIDKPLDISLVRITQNTPVSITHEPPVQTKEMEKNKESESTISHIQGYINKKYDELAMSSLKKETTTRSVLVNPKRRKLYYQLFPKSNLLTEVNCLREELKEKNIVIKNLKDKSFSTDDDDNFPKTY